ncbi:unnamed protein product, partial [Notodromas monacha]
MKPVSYLIVVASATLAISTKAVEIIVLTPKPIVPAATLEFMRSALGYGYKVEFLRGTDIILNLESALEDLGEIEGLIVLYCHGPGSLLNGGPHGIIAKFLKTQAKILFAAERNFRANETLTSLYPDVGSRKKFLSSTGFMGFASDILDLLASQTRSKKRDLHTFFSLAYLDPHLRQKFGIRLDTKSTIFHVLNNGIGELTLTMSGIAPVLKNEVEKNVPFVIQAYGSYLWELHQLANFIPGAWDPETKQCVACRMGYFNH